MTANKQCEPLTAEQIAFYQAFGFVALRQAFSREEMSIIEREFETTVSEDRHGKPFDGQENQVVRYRIVHQLDARGLTQRVHHAAEQLLGSGTIMTADASSIFSGETAWHADEGWHPSMRGGRSGPPPGHFHPGVQVAMYLDPLTRDTGCLRVLPCSHLLPNAAQDLLAPTHMDIPENFSPDGRLKGFDIAQCDVPCHAIESKPGDVILFSNQIWHASFGGKFGRRMLSLMYKSKPTTDREREHIQRELKLKREAEAGNARS